MRNPSNAGKVMTIHNLPILLAEVFPKAFTPTNMLAGFESTSIQPLSKERIPKDRNMSSYVSDQPEPTESAVEPQQPEPTTQAPSESNATISFHVFCPICQGGP
ncbi:tigger transposable element-derived protein 6-like protein [Elysia marginata]|uniref:Tigger transposable element-derived protein 6-like protein n=1 Tax=Elysia marginata TaxID=1093978 RepID=A0AAV4ISJ1_9GAST|nr:tigger transposable element-derived protein 6-like protein [Elysia marginata]